MSRKWLVGKKGGDPLTKKKKLYSYGYDWLAGCLFAGSSSKTAKRDVLYGEYLAIICKKKMPTIYYNKKVAVDWLWLA